MFKFHTKFLIYWIAHLDHDCPLLVLEPSASPKLQVFVRIIIRSVRILGRRTFGATTPQASLKRRFILNVYFFDGWVGTDGGSGHGAPNLKFYVIILVKKYSWRVGGNLVGLGISFYIVLIKNCKEIHVLMENGFCSHCLIFWR